MLHIPNLNTMFAASRDINMGWKMKHVVQPQRKKKISTRIVGPQSDFDCNIQPISESTVQYSLYTSIAHEAACCTRRVWIVASLSVSSAALSLFTPLDASEF